MGVPFRKETITHFFLGTSPYVKLGILRASQVLCLAMMVLPVLQLGFRPDQVFGDQPLEFLFGSANEQKC